MRVTWASFECDEGSVISKYFLFPYFLYSVFFSSQLTGGMSVDFGEQTNTHNTKL